MNSSTLVLLSQLFVCQVTKESQIVMRGFKGGAAAPSPPFLENFTKIYEKNTEMNV